MTHGHLLASIDPLELAKHYADVPSLAEKFRFPDQRLKRLIDPANYGFSDQDLDKEFHINSIFTGSTILQKQKVWKLRDLLAAYHNAYCSNIGVEFMHIEDKEKCNWIREKFEKIQYIKDSEEEKLH